MSSSVYYKFKSQRQESRVTFDGTGISVFDLKKEIILQNNLKASDIDLLLYDNTEQEYKDDSFIIPRSTSVIAKRMPAIRPGKGRAAIYVANIGATSSGADDSHGRPGSSGPSTGPSGGGRFGGMSRRFDGRDQKAPSAPPVSSTAPLPASSYSAPPPVVPPPSSSGEDEAASIAAMFAETSEQWEQTQEKMAQSRPIYNRTFMGNRPQHSGGQHQQRQPDTRPLPPGYICHRCNKRGHWIQDCPTNDDREYDNRPRVKRTTGIPRSFLKTVDVSEGPPMKGVMVTPEGGFVVAEPDSAAWERQRNKPKGLTEAEVKDRPPRDPSLACPYPACGKLLRDAVKTPCCQTTYCEDCIHTHLLDKNFECPKCKTRIASLDKLKINSDLRAKVRDYIRTTVEESRKEAEASEVAAPVQPQPAKSKTPEPKAEEDYSEQQPGNETNNQQPYLDPQSMVTQLQAQLAQLMIMQSNPTLPPPARMNIANQIHQLTILLKQAEQARDMMAMNMMGGMGMMNGMGMHGNGMMGNGMGMQARMMGGYGGHPQQQQQWNKPMPVQQPNNTQSAYDRLPVNAHRQKRVRPEDFGEGGPDQKRQYWE